MLINGRDPPADSRLTAIVSHPPDRLRVVSWNVNGLRACAGKGFSRWLARARGRDRRRAGGARAARGAARGARVAARAGTRTFVAGERARLQRRRRSSRAARPTTSRPSLGEPRFDGEGRLQLARFGRLVVANVYFPNGNGKDRDNSRMPYKLDFYRALFDALERLRRAGRRVLVMGDFNTAHREIDLARPKDNAKTTGFTARGARGARPLDRARAGSTRSAASSPAPATTPGGASASACARKNIGWRIDYVLASPAACRFLRPPSSSRTCAAATTAPSASTSTPPFSTEGAIGHGFDSCRDRDSQGGPGT